MDRNIEKAFQEAAEGAGQNASLGRKLVAWFDAIASGNEDINDPQSSGRHLELLYDETVVEDAPNSEEPV